MKMVGGTARAPRGGRLNQPGCSVGLVRARTGGKGEIGIIARAS